MKPNTKDKIISIFGETMLCSPFLLITIPTDTTMVFVLSFLLISIYKRLYMYEFHFDNNNQKWCVISSYILLLSIISVYNFTHNYYISISLCALFSLANSKIGYLYLNYLKLKEITPYYDMLKSKYEKIRFETMTSSEIVETCLLNKVSKEHIKIILAIYIDNKTIKELSTELNYEESSIRSIVCRVKKKCKIE